MSRKRRVKLPAEPVEAVIENLSHEMRGIATIEGKTVFIQNALPGEKVLFKYTNKFSKYDEGLAIEILENSNTDRISPKCEHYALCGGCSAQHIAPQAQVDHKQNVLLEHLAHFGNLELGAESILPPLTGPNWHYRRKARLGVRYVHKKEKVLVGFRERNGRFLADINFCHILDKKIAGLIKPLSDLIINFDSKAQIPQIEVAVGDKQHGLIIRHLEPLNNLEIESLKEFSKSHNIILYLQPKGPKTVHKLYPEPEPEQEDDNLFLDYSPYADLNLKFHPSDFTQVNADINQQMIKQALNLLEPNKEDNILDLFCGLGNFTLPIAKYCQSITGVEGCEEMVQRAGMNASLNQINNTNFYAADLSEDCSEKDWAKSQYHKIILDPPRSGALAMMPLLPILKPEKILYVSCNPATLARDAGILVQDGGYDLQCAGIMDMFPHTTHVESMALFVKK